MCKFLRADFVVFPVKISAESIPFLLAPYISVIKLSPSIIVFFLLVPKVQEPLKKLILMAYQDLLL